MSGLLLCFRNVRRSVTDGRGTIQMEYWTKWSNIRSVDINFCNITGSSRAILKMDHESLYVHCNDGSILENKLKQAHLNQSHPLIIYIDDETLRYN
jgi:hypothetical protein